MRSVPSEMLSLREGSEVEISYRENGFKNVWYKAMIESNSKSRLRQLCVRLLKDDSSTLLTHLINKVTFRPVPPEDVQVGIDIKVGSIIDADYKGGWWTGLVVKQTEVGKCLVLFDSSLQILQFERKHLRPHLDWFDDNRWVIPGPDLEFLREESMFSSGTMVEVCDKKNKGEVVWVPAIIIKEIEEMKYIVKVCDDPWSWLGINTRPNKSVDLPSVRPRPPPFSVEELQLAEYIEVFHGTSWRQGRLTGMMSESWFHGKWCKVILEGTKQGGCFKLSDVRPSKTWQGGVWKPRESPLNQGLVNKMSDTLMNEESGPPVTSPPGITARDNGTSEDDGRKRKRNQNLSSVEEREAKDIAMVLPFEKKLPIWKRVESMEVYKRFPQSPHFIPLLESREDCREMSAVGMMLTFSGLLEEVKTLQLNSPISSLNSLSDSFAELEKHGFDVQVPMLRISKLLSLREEQAKKMKELKDAEKVTAEKESIKGENEGKILDLQRLNKEVDKEIAQSKLCEATVAQQLEDVELQFHTTASAPW
ncbi:DUF724 domain-containing protein 10-like isoform X2 [Raphanus sativus]|uniref:DUF724 domain-containing protein 10-like isoform X2 n=1 Tax=Raphanus sativus TaxID=3726 RepID=A0A9W3CD29_RAPSA|nr:DUF724 domain-containing protein 10-like isoform X2 [Raphanus sativus]